MSRGPDDPGSGATLAHVLIKPDGRDDSLRGLLADGDGDPEIMTVTIRLRPVTSSGQEFGISARTYSYAHRRVKDTAASLSSKDSNKDEFHSIHVICSNVFSLNEKKVSFIHIQYRNNSIPYFSLG